MSRVSKNVFANLLGNLILVVIGFLSVKWIFRDLGGEALGIIYFSTMVNTLLCAVLEAGMSFTIVREVSSNYANDPEYVAQLLRMAASVYWLLYILAAAGVMVLAPWLARNWISLEHENLSTAALALRILGAASLIALPKSLYLSFFRGLQRMQLTNIMEVSAAILQQVGTIVVIAAGGGLVATSIWIAASYALRMVPYLALTGHQMGWGVLLPGFFRNVIRRNLAFALQGFSLSLLAIGHGQVDKLILSKFLPAELFGAYGMLSGATAKFAMVPGAFSQAGYPHLSELFVRQDKDRLLKEFRRLVTFVCIAMTAVAASLPFVASNLWTAILNARFAALLGLPTLLLCGAAFLDGVLRLPGTLAFVCGKPQLAVRTSLIVLCIVLPISIPLMLRFGILGAALGILALKVFACLHLVPRVYNQCLAVSSREWYLLVARTLGLAALTYGVVWFAMETGNPPGFLVAACGYVFATAMFLLGGFLVFGSDYRNAVHFALQKLRIATG
jgi:O-antigen/teichoic acid export membrane protein